LQGGKVAALTKTAERPTGLILHAAAGYDAMVWLLTLGRERAFREKMLRPARLQPGETVVDVGCGTGTLAILAKRQVGPGGAVHGIDASREMIARATRKARRARAEVSFAEGAAQALPFADGELDVVLSTLVLHHLPRKACETFAGEVRRVLKANGRVLAVDFGEASHGRVGRLHFGHGRTRPDDIVAILRGAGLNILDSGAVGSGSLNYALASPGNVDIETLAAQPDPGRGRSRVLLAAAGFAGIAALIALHLGAVASLNRIGLAGIAGPIPYALAGIVLFLLVLKLGFAGRHRLARWRRRG